MLKGLEAYCMGGEPIPLFLHPDDGDNVHGAFHLNCCWTVTQLFTSEALRDKINLWHILVIRIKVTIRAGTSP